MALPRERKDTSQTLLASHAHFCAPAADNNNNTRPSTAASTTATTPRGIIVGNAPIPNPPFILGHCYQTEWKTARAIEAQRLKLVPRFVLQDSVGPMTHPIEESYEKLSNSKGRPFGGEVSTGAKSYFVENGDVRSATPTNGKNNKKVIKGVCPFGNTPRMVSAQVHNEMAKSAGQRPSSATSKAEEFNPKINASNKTALEKKYGPLQVGMFDGTSLPGSAYRKVMRTPAANEYDIRKANRLVREQSPRCSFGTCARFDGGAAASEKCRPRSTSATTARGKNADGSNNKQSSEVVVL